MADDQGEKSFEATPRKLEKARQEGDIPRSQELQTALAYLGFAVYLLFVIRWAVSDLWFDLRDVFETLTSDRGLAAGTLSNAFATALQFVIVAVLPGSAFLLLGITANKGFSVSLKRIEPKLKNISMIDNFKKKYGSSGLFEFVKSSSKLMIIMFFLVAFLVFNSNTILGMAGVSSFGLLFHLRDGVQDFFNFVCVFFIALALVDTAFQRAQFNKRHRMTYQELADDTKEAEGDGHLKQRRRSFGYELASGTMLHDVPDAAVVIVNPTHFAVAIRWSADRDPIPICCAKGVDFMAAQIRRVAIENDVPIYSDPPTARDLFANIPVGSEIDRRHFGAVAAAIRFAERIMARSPHAR